MFMPHILSQIRNSPRAPETVHNVSEDKVGCKLKIVKVINGNKGIDETNRILRVRMSSRLPVKREEFNADDKALQLTSMEAGIVEENNSTNSFLHLSFVPSQLVSHTVIPKPG